MTKKERSWIAYDWANSAYSMAITSSILPIFYKSYAASGIDSATSTAYWGYSNTIATIIIAILSPILGTLADYRGNKKRFFTIFLLLGVFSTAALSLVGEGNYIFCLLIYILTTVGFNGGNLFYDAFMVDVTTEDRYHKVSTYGYSFGYIGSTIPFIISIAFIMMADKLGVTSIFATRFAFIFTAVWWFAFSIPLLKNVKQENYLEPEPRPFLNSFVRLGKTFKKIKQYKAIVIYLIAFFLYIDGVHTIISMATAYGYDIGIPENTLMIVLLVVQFVAFPCAIFYNYLAEKYFSVKTMLLFGIATYIVITIIAYRMTTELEFWIVALLVGTAQGGIQALSRSAFGKIVPKQNSAEFFGFYNIFGKLSSSMGPLAVGITAQLTGNSRLGILVLIIFFIIGGLVLYKLDFENSRSAEQV